MEKKVRVLEVFGEPISNGGQESFVINIVQHINHEHLHISDSTSLLSFNPNRSSNHGLVVSIHHFPAYIQW